jgi:hypothetical protein
MDSGSALRSPWLQVCIGNRGSKGDDVVSEIPYLLSLMTPFSELKASSGLRM